MATTIMYATWLFCCGVSWSVDYPDNEDGEFEDILTPAYYLAADGAPFRVEVNKFIHFARQERLRHPFQNESGEIAAFVIPVSGDFGAGKGPNGDSEHHPACDLHRTEAGTNIAMYAAHDGLVKTFRDSSKYRHYLTISKTITDDQGTTIGKMVTIYAHIELDLDEADFLQMNGQSVNQGDLVSGHLYSGTMGGPHLHFEVRYYRPGDAGDEEYYSFTGVDFTEPSAGPWTYGVWKPDVAYGYGNPRNHGLFLPSASGGGSFWIVN